jgi:hypothetical protein
MVQEEVIEDLTDTRDRFRSPVTKLPPGKSHQAGAWMEWVLG